MLALKRFKPKKARGKDGIQNIVLKNQSRKVITQLTIVFYACLRLFYFTKKWKEAQVLAFKKPGKDKLFPQNYRPISLLSTMSKVLEKVILSRIQEYNEKYKL